MKNSELYYTLPTIRKMRRMLRKTSKQAYRDMTKSCGKASIKLYDSKDRNILKTRRWRNRLMTTKTIWTMKLTVFYEAIDPYYSSHEQVFIGIDEASCYSQKDEYEDWLGRYHPNGIRNIYKVTSEQLSK